MPHHANYHVLMMLISSPFCCKTSPSAEFERIIGVGSLKLSTHILPLLDEEWKEYHI
jgi:hypothetical protein